MMLGLKRDLRTEGEGIIYPQEVRDSCDSRAFGVSIATKFLRDTIGLDNTVSQFKRVNITRYFQYGHGERLPVMMLGLKRDLRTEGEGIIYAYLSQRSSCAIR
jgi:hypothetical protein